MSKCKTRVILMTLHKIAWTPKVINNYKDLVESLNLDIKRNTKIAFILGSATTMSPDGKGVPGVREINGIMKQFMMDI